MTSAELGTAVVALDWEVEVPRLLSELLVEPGNASSLDPDYIVRVGIRHLLRGMHTGQMKGLTLPSIAAPLASMGGGLPAAGNAESSSPGIGVPSLDAIRKS